MAAGTRVLAAKNPYLSELINDDEFGRLFIGDDDLAEVTKSAIRDLHPIDKDKFEKKLYEISAENFAKKVYLFYIDTIIEYNNLKSIEAERFPMKMKIPFAKCQLLLKMFT